MQVKAVWENKKQYLDLLLLADEQESMIDRYLERGTMFALFDDGLRTVCVVTDEGGGVLEVKNLATVPQFQGQGWGRQMLAWLADFYHGRYQIMQVGTGDSPLTLPFYLRCGFRQSHIVKDFFLENYDHPIYEAGKQLRDMIYLQKEI